MEDRPMTGAGGMLNRRSFMKESAAASAAFATALEAFEAQQAMAGEAPKVGRPLNVAIIGSGSEGNMLIGQAVSESTGIYSLVIAILLIFVVNLRNQVTRCHFVPQ